MERFGTLILLRPFRFPFKIIFRFVSQTVFASVQQVYVVRGFAFLNADERKDDSRVRSLFFKLVSLNHWEQ